MTVHIKRNEIFFLYDRDLSFIKYHAMTQRADSMTTANAKIVCDSSNSCYKFKIEAVNQNIEWLFMQYCIIER